MARRRSFKKRGSLIILESLLLLLMGCGGSTFDAAEVINLGGGTYSDASLEGGAVSEVSFDGSSQAMLQFGTVSDTSQYVLAIYSYNSGGSTEAYQLGNSQNLTDLGNLLNSKALIEDQTIDLHERLREEENNLDLKAALNQNSSEGQKALQVVKHLEIGSERTFKVLNSFSAVNSYASVKAVLRYQTTNFRAYVDERNLSSLSGDELSDLLENFDSIVERERALYGEESDVDGDGVFNILFTQEVNALGGSSGGIVTGFFYAVDLFDASTYPQSNETEVYYTFVPDPDGDFGTPISTSFALSNILPSVLPHEFQHMINFNMHYFEKGGSPEYAFLNEGLSHLAEDIMSINANGYMESAGIENPARVSGYLESIDDLCIVCGASLYQRGGSYLLLRYLYEQAQKGNLPAVSSGQQLLQRLLDTDEIGVDNMMQAAYGDEVSVEEQFRALMGQFGLALFMSNTGLSTDSRLSFDGINLRGNQDDNRGTVLRGPIMNSISSFPLSNTIAGASISFVEILGEDINHMGGSIGIALSSNSQSGAYLIQTGY